MEMELENASKIYLKLCDAECDIVATLYISLTSVNQLESYEQLILHLS